MGSTGSSAAAAQPAPVTDEVPPPTAEIKEPPITLGLTADEKDKMQSIYESLGLQVLAVPGGLIGAQLLQRASGLRSPFLPVITRAVVSLGVGIGVAPWIVGKVCIEPVLATPELCKVRFKTLRSASQLRNKFSERYFANELVVSTALVS